MNSILPVGILCPFERAAAVSVSIVNLSPLFCIQPTISMQKIPKVLSERNLFTGSATQFVPPYFCL